MTGRRLRLFALLAAALLLAGCAGWAHGPGDGSRRHRVTGRVLVVVGDHAFPLTDGRLVVSGASHGTTYTTRNGRYTYSRLAKGWHDLTLHALHGVYEKTLYVAGDAERPHSVDWTVQPRRVDPETFFFLSGLKDGYLDHRGYFQWEYAPLIRWEQSLIRVYFDEEGAPGALPADTVARYLVELRRWEGYLNHRVAILRTDDPAKADVHVSWVPQDYWGELAGVTRHTAFYANGALKKVTVEIDVAWANFPGLWEHEWAHAMGLGHVKDVRSVLHPQLSYNRRTALSADERAMARLMYDIPSGQRLNRSSPYGAGPSGSEADPSDLFVESVSAGTESGRREHRLYVDPDLRHAWLSGGGSFDAVDDYWPDAEADAFDDDVGVDFWPDL